jgi:hypothetical protein
MGFIKFDSQGIEMESITQRVLSLFGPGTAGIAQRIESRYGTGLEVYTSNITTSVLSRNYLGTCGHNQYG